MIKYVLKKKNISKSLLYDNNPESIWTKLLKNNEEKKYNIILSIKIFYERLEKLENLSKKENELYSNMTETEKKITMILTINACLSKYFNEIVKPDLMIIGDIKNIWLTVSLDSIYSSTSLNHIKFKKIFGSNLKENDIKRIEIEIIICTLDRVMGIFLYCRQNKKNVSKCPKELKEIKFTKGYLVCISPDLNNRIIEYKYLRKLITKNHNEIKIIKNNMTVIESLRNDSYSNPIWIKSNNVENLDIKKLKININLESRVEVGKIEKIIQNLNFLNSQKVKINKELLKETLLVIEKNFNNKDKFATKNILINNILFLNTENSIKSLEGTNVKSLINSIIAIDLIIKQIEYYSEFYLNYKMDSRLRIYCENWPINYQLNHIIRNSISFYNNENIEKCIKKILNHWLIKKYINGVEIFEHKKEKNIAFDKWSNEVCIKDEYKKEFVFLTIEKISEKINKINKIEIFINYINDFINSDLSKDWVKWKKILNLNNKKIPYIVNYQKILKDALKNKYECLFWADASSNAIQLITIRLNKWNEKILMLTNIINNSTEYENIYDYVSKKFKKMNHKELIKNLELEEEDIEKIISKNIIKYLLMPASYGMGKKSFKKYLKEILIDEDQNDLIEKLKNKIKNLSEYIWDKTEEILKEVDYDMEEYKKYCKIISEMGYDIIGWETDIGVIIAPISLIKTKRQILLKKIKKEKEKNLESNKLKKLEEKIKKDEKDFWKRYMIKTNKNEIYVRAGIKNKIIDKHGSKTSLSANTIHAYDASIIHLICQIAKEIDLQILVIHDSVGCNPLMAPYLKMIFKIVNIYFIDKNDDKEVFPINKKIKINKKEELFKKIIISKNFFR